MRNLFMFIFCLIQFTSYTNASEYKSFECLDTDGEIAYTVFWDKFDEDYLRLEKIEGNKPVTIENTKLISQGDKYTLEFENNEMTKRLIFKLSGQSVVETLDQKGKSIRKLKEKINCE